jgi:YcaO cyclodehydratase, ATP-ad Mg2+-binding
VEARTPITALIAATHGNALELIEYEDVLSYHRPRTYACVRDVRTGAEGHGDSEDSELAWLRAYAEWCERIALNSLGNVGEGRATTSSGFAAHSDKRSAGNAAINELIEHDAVLLCWLAKAPPAWIRDDAALARLNAWARETKAKLRTLGIELNVGLQAVTGNIVTAVAAGRLQFGTRGLFVTSGAAVEIPDAIERATREALRTANALVTRERLGLSLAQPIEAHSLRGPDDHRNFWISSGTTEDIDWFIEGATDVTILESFDVSVSLVELPFVPAVPLTIARASSVNAQRMFWGASDATNLSHERLRNLTGITTPATTLPHPYA